MSAPVGALERAYRDERAAVLATITRRLGGDLALAEDAVQDAFVAAAVDWDRGGVPERPGAWLTTTAWRRALDRRRRDRVAAAHAPDLVGPVSYDPELDFDRSSLDDDQLRMLFTCCHPALAPEARMALTLRSAAGLTVPEIARAFLSSESAMERRLVRARRKISDAGIPFRVPGDELLPERLAGVLRVVYLLYTEGHVATAGEPPVRAELCDEAIRLARLLARLMPDEAEAPGLLALLLLTDARRAARLDADGGFVSLEHQDRTRWDAAKIADGAAVLERALRLGRPGAYVLQAAIAALHAQAPAWEATDWRGIAALYAELERHDPSPVVTVNRAVAVGLPTAPRRGWRSSMRSPATRLERYQPLHAARAELLRRAGDAAGADAAYARAIALSGNPAERAALGRRRREAAGGLAAPGHAVEGVHHPQQRAAAVEVHRHEVHGVPADPPALARAGEQRPVRVHLRGVRRAWDGSRGRSGRRATGGARARRSS
ncbi:MAG TPA: sigma-70 family RNA polymerase sigma factor, partial [Solirubrobacteraceae bacterium]|nr:sigma-70 family RNA polymerase sigma factor [Solirubrobacteraceae bacterium]